jgi:copper oxidase (laccase) domain-containing protein
VGPEVHEALGLPAPDAPTPIDLREILAQRGTEQGIPKSQISRSAFCTRCHNDRFYSHRRGDPERQVGFLGIREPQSAAGNLAG